MAKRKVIKFVYQGHRSAKAGEYYTVGDKSEMFYAERDRTLPQYVYHRIETEEEVPRWRAEDGNVYYGVTSYYKIVKSFEQNSPLDDMMYDSGNYFQTEKKAQEYIDHCKKFFENN